LTVDVDFFILFWFYRRGGLLWP